MASFAEYTKKKKKQSIAGMSFEDYTKSMLGTDFFDEDIAPTGGGKRRDIVDVAPVKEEKDRNWFQKSGFFDDGYQLFDVSKAILGTYKDVEENLTAGILGMGEKAVDTGAYLLGKAGGLVGADKFQNKMGDFIQKDLYDEEKLAKKVSPFVGIPGLGYISGKALDSTGLEADEASVFGEKTDSLTQSGGQLGATIALQAMGMPWLLTTGVTSFGGEAENALKQDATYNEAGGSALITAGADILTERLSGGIKFGGKTLDDVMLKPLTEKISSKVARTLTNFGIDAVGEGAEEVIASVFSNLGSALYKEESIGELLTSEEAVDEYIESFIGGAVLGGGVSGVNAVASLKSGRDYSTGLTENEQKVIDKEIENRIDGRELSKKEKAELEAEVKEDLQKGNISIDTIESVLDSDNYNAYQNLLNESEEFKALYETESGKLSEKQKDRLAYLKESNEKQSYESRISEYKQTASQRMSEMLGKDTFLQESYNEKARRSQQYEADLTKYDEKQQEVIKKAVDSGILNNTRKTHEFVDMIAKLSADKGVLFDFTNNEALKESGFAVEGKTINGYVKDGNITLNINSNKALNTVVGHEITHVLEGTDLYNELQTAVIQYAHTKGEYTARKEALTKLYEGVENVNIDNELTADLVGDYLFTDSNFINSLSTEKPNVFKKIYNEIKYLLKVATAGSKEARELEKVKRAFDKVYKETANKTTSSETVVAEQTVEEVQLAEETIIEEAETVNKELTAEQQEYFKDSVVRDENGNLKPMYHGTSKGGHTVFDPYGASNYGLFGVGTYFTDDVNVAKSYMNKGKGNVKMVYGTYLNITNPIDMDAEANIEAWKKAFPEADYPEKGTNQDFYWAMEEYFVDNEYSKAEATETARDVLESMGYDGITHIGGGRFNKADDTRHRVYIAFNPEQIKAISNDKPTKDADIWYSLSEQPLEERLSGDALLDAQDLIAEIEDVAEISPNGYVTLYHRTTEENAKKIRETGKMSAKEDGIFFSTLKSGDYSVDYGSGIVELKVPVEKLVLDDIFDNEAHLKIPLRNRNAVLDVSKYLVDSTKFSLSEDIEALKEKQLDIVLKTNPAHDSYHTWIRSKEDILTFEEALNSDDYVDYKGEEFDESYPYSVAEEALKTGKITVYSSYPIKQGVFVSPSRMEAETYSGNGKVYSKKVSLTDVAWVDPTQGQYANVNANYSLSISEKDIAPTGKYNVYGKDIALEKATEDVAPVVEEKTDLVQEKTDLVQEAPVQSENWRDIASNLKEYDFTISDKVAELSVKEVIADVDNGLTASELFAKSNEAIEAYHKIQANKPREEAYTPAEELLLSTYYTRYTMYDSVARNRDFVNQYKAIFEKKFAPMTEAEANERDAIHSDRLYSLDESDMPEEVEAPYSEPVEAVSPFDEKDIQEVGDRKQKAYMYENPEVKPYFQEEAQVMLGELRNSIKGERVVNADLVYESGGEFGVWGTKRETSEQIAYMLDKFKYSYADIEKGLNAIIEDNGAENNAISKRLEFMIDERLREGYTDFISGMEIPSNQDYINLLKEKQINNYTDEAYNQYLESLAEAEAPVEDTPVEDIAPTQAYEAIEPEPQNLDALEEQWAKNKMARADKEAEKIAEILDVEPTTENQRNSRKWAIFRANVFDKGSVFEDLALKTKNRELMGKWNYTLYSESRAQRLMGEGDKEAGIKSLNDIRAEVENTGLTHQFYEYMYHKHNVDRMSLEAKAEAKHQRLKKEIERLKLDTLAEKQLFAISKEEIKDSTTSERKHLINTVKEYLSTKDVKNKPVFGYSVTAEMSQEIVNQYEFAQPEFMDYANDIYKYNTHLRQQLVDNGVISQETADLWNDMYPHYVPIRRVDTKGLNVNVPLDTGRTGVNAPVKRAKGGNTNILPLFDTMAMRTLQTYKATAKNSFGVELKNVLGTVVEKADTNIDEVIESVDSQEELLQKGKNGQKPTFTVFENGERVTYEITEDMYDAFKPLSDSNFMSKTIKPLNVASSIHRGLLTEYNPVFIITNGIKDIQDILINSQHPARTYVKIPEAYGQLLKKGYWYNEYMNNGGDYNSYFDSDTNTFKTENKGLAKILDVPPLSTISRLNNYVEMIPRLAEYIASREAGRSIEVSMLDSARVTTNFRAGGDLTKFANRNGATFLNASVQGALQQVRNVREAKANGFKGWANLATKFALAGAPAYLLNALLWDDDEEYEELSDYVKQNYYIVGKYDDGKFIRIPKGRTVAVIQDAIKQVSDMATGNDEADLKSFLQLVVTNLAPANPIENNILAPIIQAKNNETWYGEDLVPTRLQDLPASEQFDESTDLISKWLGEKSGISPVKINYLLDQYSGGVGDVVLPMLTPEAESGDNSALGNMIAPLKKKFTVDSVMNNQNVTDFYDTSDELTTNAKMSTATDADVLMNKYINSIKGELSDLYKRKRDIQNGTLPDDVKYERVRELQNEIVALSKEGLKSYKGVSISGNYATVGDRHYKRDESGEWIKLTDKQIEKLEEVTGGLGISASEYWSNKEEYDFAYEQPEKHAMSKVFGGYDTYKTYTSELNDIKADKDENGKTINGSRKEKVLNYVDSLDADYGTKLILFKSVYNSEDDFNNDIIEYLNNRNDISYEEEMAILKELGFTVDSDGTIYW